MLSANNFHRVIWWSIASLVFGGFYLSTATAEVQTNEPSASLRNDASLADLFFLNKKLGWAVGDRGVIWHTVDGGRRWYLQSSGVSCRLESVQFVDEKNGWAAGGFTHPYTHTSESVLLKTNDGGLTWRQQRKLTLPRIKKIHFFGSRGGRHGWAIAKPNVLNPTGIYQTGDYGRSWSTVPTDRNLSWSMAHFQNARQALFCTENGDVGKMQQQRIVTKSARVNKPPTSNQDSITAIHLSDNKNGWRVGKRGLVQMTSSGGATWQTPNSLRKLQNRTLFDFQAIATVGRSVWITGSPGTNILFSNDAGQSWQWQNTRQNLPLHSITFKDEKQGWAAGSLGTILATTDAGKTWQRQRSGANRVAMLGVYSHPGSLPWEMVARYSAGENYLIHAYFINPTIPYKKQNSRSTQSYQAHEAMVEIGASGANYADRFPLPIELQRFTPQEIVDSWKLGNRKQVIEKMQRSIMRQILIWRPTVVFTARGKSNQTQPIELLIRQATLQAIENAKQPQVVQAMFTGCGFQAWKVAKVVEVSAVETTSRATVRSSKIIPHLGRSLAQSTIRAKGLIRQSYRFAPAGYKVRRLADHSGSQHFANDLFKAIPLQLVSGVRRKRSEIYAAGLNSIKQNLAVQRQLKQIIDDPSQLNDLNNQSLKQLTAMLEPKVAAEILFDFAYQLQRAGHWETADQVNSYLLKRFPSDSLSWSMKKSQMTYRCSAELAHLTKANEKKLGHKKSKSTKKSRYDQILSRAKEIQNSSPILYAQPSLQFSLGRAHRYQNKGIEAMKIYQFLGNRDHRDDWSKCAEGEKWIQKPTRFAPKLYLMCGETRQKPYLDGVFNDSLWKKSQTVQLSGLRWKKNQSRVKVSYDKEFLYFAITCEKLKDLKYQPISKRRSYDSVNLSGDRIELRLDIDRDYNTYYQFTVDCCGQTAESCMINTAWNPKWHVATRQTDQTWTVEIAIPFSSITSKPPQLDEVWAISLQRHLPNQATQSWTSSNKPQGFGYLIFQ